MASWRMAAFKSTVKCAAGTTAAIMASPAAAGFAALDDLRSPDHLFGGARCCTPSSSEESASTQQPGHRRPPSGPVPGPHGVVGAGVSNQSATRLGAARQSQMPMLQEPLWMIRERHCHLSTATGSLVDKHGAAGPGKPLADTALQKSLNRRMCRATEPKEVLSIVLEFHKRFDAINCSTALSRLAMHWKARAIPWESRQTVDRALPLLLSHLVRNRAELTPRALATSLYGLSKLRKADARLLGALEPAVVAACPGFTPQELSNVLWAHGKARVVAPAALAALAEQAERRAASFKPQEISSIVSSLAALNQTPPRMLEAMEEQVVRRASSFKPQEISNTVLAYARMGAASSKLLETVAHQVVKRLGEMNLYDMKQILQAFSISGFRAPGMLSSLENRALAWREEMTTEQAAVVLQATSNLGAATPRVSRALFLAAVSSGEELAPQEVAAFAVSVAALPEIFREEDLGALAPHVSACASQLCQKTLGLLFQVELALGRRCGDGMLLPASLYSIAQRQWLESPGHAADPGLQLSVRRALAGLGVDCEPDWRSDDGLVPVDIMAFLGHGRQVAIQVDGQARYTRSEPYSLLEGARLHKRMLQHRCPDFVSISFFDWDQFETDAERAESLAAALGLSRSGVREGNPVRTARR